MFIAVSVEGKPPQVAYHEHGMLVHRVNVEQIVLHPAHHVGESRQISSQYAIAVHPAQLVSDTAGFSEDFHKQATSLGVVTEVVINLAKMLAD